MSTTLSKRAATAILHRITRSLWGVPPNLIAEIVERLGAVGAITWFARNLPPYEKIMKRWGPLRGHMACLEASLMNGCAYCVYAHSYAFQLHYFREREALFPLDEHAIVALRGGTDAAVTRALEAALQTAGLSQEIEDFATLRALKLTDRIPATDDERSIAHILRMFDILNYCGIDSLVTFDHAHDPINKDEALKIRYAEARLAHRPVEHEG